jgi:competence protein ComEC
VLHKEIPFLRIGLPLCAGIITSLYLKPGTILLVSILIIIIAGFSLSFFFNKYQTNKLFGFTLNISLFTCGLVLYTYEKESLTILTPEPTKFICTLSDFPAEKENSYMLTVKLNSRITSRGTEKVKGSMVLYSRKDSSKLSLLPGDILTISCTPIEIVNKGNPYEFDYRFYMENQGIKYYAFTNNNNFLKHITPAHRKLAHRALIVREKLIDM